ncbi:gamma-glutamyltransferase family protein [Alteribacillus sp. YIM 98480]|uniref:gamma-glutamyltransferase family protein n=1 Tax=Alteribacillus sp. YIM 98480 TaxID=2606599 RepID=UPI00131D1921|nr:gamma-glutamyltransferase [Alteribacillus sp. YIM 98480]
MSATKLTNILAGIIILGFAIYFFMSNTWNENAEDSSPDFEDDAQKVSLEEFEGYGVSSSNDYAIETGMDILEKGGNAIDAAVAVSFTLAVTEPYGSGLGGGGAMLYMPSLKNDPITYDYRETASTQNPADQIAIPGFVKGMQTIHETHGELPIDELLQPAISYAENGFKVNPDLHYRLKNAAHRIQTEEVPHFYPEGEPIEIGETLVQEDLANTLKQLQTEGLNDFYEGNVSNSISGQVPHINSSDLSQYTVDEKEPVKGTFEDHTVYSAPPPLSGTTFIQMLGMAEHLNIKNYLNNNKAEYIHLMSEITREAYYQRLNTIGDPNFENVNVDHLTSDDFIRERANYVTENRLSEEVILDVEQDNNMQEHTSTTHFVIIDKEGKTVSATNTLGNFFGSGNMVDGMWMNSNLGNFSDDPNSPNYIEIGKRPRSFIAPSIIKNETSEVVMGIGTPGGNRIPGVLSQFLIRQAYLEEDYQDTVNAGRFHPEKDLIHLEDTEAFIEDQSLIAQLESYGYDYQVEGVSTYFGNVSALIKDYDKQEMTGIADERREGSFDIN